MDARSEVPRFGLGWVCWVAGGVVALLVGTVSVLRARHPEPAYLAGSFVFGAVLAVLLAVLVALVVWRVAGRSRRAGQVGFVIWLVVELAGSAVGVVKHVIVVNTVHRLREVQARRLDDLMARLPEPLSSDQRPVAEAALDAYFDPVAAGAIGDGVTVVEAVRAHHRIDADNLLDLKAAVDAIKDVDPTDFTGAGTRAERARRGGALRAALDATARCRQFQTGQLAALHARIAALQDYDRFADIIVEDLARPGLLMGPLDAQAAFFTQLVEMYDFLDAREGGWQVTADGTLSFTKGEDAARFQAGLDGLSKLMAETARKNAEELAAAPGHGSAGSASTPPGSP